MDLRSKNKNVRNTHTRTPPKLLAEVGVEIDSLFSNTHLGSFLFYLVFVFNSSQWALAWQLIHRPHTYRNRYKLRLVVLIQTTKREGDQRRSHA